MLNYCSGVEFSSNFKGFVREKVERTCYAQLTGFVLVGSSKTLCIHMNIHVFMYIKEHILS